ncbi:dUTP diphosphatase [Bacillus amyloliquefaciens]|uniref:dUTP diphosphatase n=1 Tax=Bacillus amyloliquefaciens group TaxID=1938374 RepID=UPI00255C044E|nr:dUTP diphosphatase [Bacillus amyloliquefaciens]WIX30357.1 dUTP diphosphatase [Bacillus amyloliquefaciens]
MNLQKMFEMQKVLDDRIIKEKGLEGQDLLPNLILALQVELAECANEWRGFKHWSNDREPRTKHPLEVSPNGAFRKGGNPLLEEYVDCLHFILSIGNRLDYNDSETINIILSKYLNIRGILNPKWLFSSLISTVAFTRQNYINLFINFFTLGKRLGFTIEQIEAAYMDKNAVNHKRQQEGY